jgi:hypothetical protein
MKLLRGRQYRMSGRFGLEDDDFHFGHIQLNLKCALIVGDTLIWISAKRSVFWKSITYGQKKKPPQDNGMSSR